MLGIRNGVIKFFRSKNVFLTVPKLFVGDASVLRSRKFLVAKMFMDEWWGWVVTIFRRNVFVSQSRKIS